MIIYGAILSPFVRKVLMFAGEKGVAVELISSSPGNDDAAFVEASPFGKIPAMRDPGAGEGGADYLLADSSAICAYIEAKHPENPLIPAEPRARGETVWYDEFADTILMATGGKMFFNRIVAPYFFRRPGDLAAADAAEADELPRLLNWLEARLLGRDFLVGEALTLADISVAVMFANIAGAGYRLDGATHPNLVRWLAAVDARPSLAPHNAHMAAILAKVTNGAGSKGQLSK